MFKLSERFVQRPNSGIPASEAAARRTFLLPAGDVELVLHRRPGHIASDQLVMTRKGLLRSAKLVDPLQDPPNELKVKGILQGLLEAEFHSVTVGSR